MPIQIINSDLRTQEGGVSQFMLADNSVGSAEIQPNAVGLSELLQIGSQEFLGRNTAGTGAVEAVTIVQLQAILQARGFTWSALQTFAADLGIVLPPGLTPASLANGQMWMESDGSLWVRSAGVSLPLIRSGTFEPSISFTTPGNLNVAYSTRLGAWTLMGKRLHVSVQVTASTFTHTTASGTLIITGLPFTLVNQNYKMESVWVGTSNANLALGTASQDIFAQGFANSTTLAFRRSTGSTTVSALGFLQVGQAPTGNLISLGFSGVIGEIV